MKVLDIEPKEVLVFTANPSNKQPSRSLKLTNISDGIVAFKVKTTAPKSYLVRPSSGTLMKGKHEDVQIIMQPREQAPNEWPPSNHRFLVQAIPVDDASGVSRDSWSNFPKDQLQEKRLNVEYKEQPDQLPMADIAGGGVGRAPAGAGSVPTSTTGGGAGGWQQAAEEFKQQGTGPTKEKYEELVKYTINLEANHKKVEAELNDLKAMGKTAGREAGGGYSKRDIILVALIVFALSYAVKFIG